MKFSKTAKSSKFIKIELKQGSKPLARGFLYLIKNDLHKQPYGLIEDVFVDISQRGKGLGTKLVKIILAEAKKQKCYKVIATSRFSNKGAHKLYNKLGLKKHGAEFRINF